MSKLPYYDVIWVISSYSTFLFRFVCRSLARSLACGLLFVCLYRYAAPAPNGFADAVMAHYRKGKPVLIWGDNEPLFTHANAILQPNFGFKLAGNFQGEGLLKLQKGQKSSTPQTGTMIEHHVTTGLVTLYEGYTICHPTKVVPSFQSIATATDGNPAVIIHDPPKDSRTGISPGRIAVDCGWTKLYMNWDEAGTARYVQNLTVWLLALEKKAGPPRAFDDYPNGDPNGLTPEVLLPQLKKLKIDYCFARIQPYTDKMVKIFADIYDKDERSQKHKLRTVSLDGNATNFLQVVVDTVSQSVAAARGAGGGAAAFQ